MLTRRLWKPFTIPEKLLDSTWSSSSSALLRLPTEILILIFDQANPIDQFSLALACKHLLQVSALVCLKASPLVGSKVVDNRAMVEALLRKVRPVNKAGRKRKSWHICVDCLQYRPTKKSYWKKKERSGGEEGDYHGILWAIWVERWNGRYLIQCPDCKYDEAIPGRP